MKLTTADRRIIIQTVLGEAGGEGKKGMEAVVHVMVNRTASSRWPNTLAKVAKQSSVKNGRRIHQFSTWNTPGVLEGNNPGKYSESNKNWKTASAALDNVLGGSYDFTEGADHYHTKRVNPKWNRKMKKVNTVGAHIFWRSTSKKVDRSSVVAGYAQAQAAEIIPDDPLAILDRKGIERPGSLINKGQKKEVAPKPPVRPTIIGGSVIESPLDIPAATHKARKDALERAEKEYKQTEKDFAETGDLIVYMDETKRIGREHEISRRTVKEEVRLARDETKNAKNRRNENRAEAFSREDSSSMSQIDPASQPAMSVDEAMLGMGASTNPITGEVIRNNPPLTPQVVRPTEAAPVPPSPDGVDRVFPEVTVPEQPIATVEPPIISPTGPGRPKKQRVADPIDQEFRDEFGADAIMGGNGYAYKRIKVDKSVNSRGYIHERLGRVNNRIRAAKGIDIDPRGDRQAGNMKKRKRGSWLDRIFGKRDRTDRDKSSVEESKARRAASIARSKERRKKRNRRKRGAKSEAKSYARN